jgi:lipopolysaccharide transport system permease protein
MSQDELVIRPYSAIALRDLRELWRFRELLWTLASRDVRVRYKQAVFGVAWAVIQPLAQIAIYTLLFNRVAGIRTGTAVSYPLFTFGGIVIWSLFSTGLSQASSSLVDNSRLITKVYFPRAVVPLGSIVVALVDFVVGLVLLIAAIPIFGADYHASALLIPLFALLAALAAFSFGLWTSAINLQYRDVRYALPFFLQLLIFVTPVFYPSSLLPQNFRWLLYANPMASIVDGFRAAIFGMPVPWERVGLSTLIILVVGLSGFLYFRRMEQTFADRV